MRILIVEDNAKMAEALRGGLSGQGYAVDVAHSGFEAEELACAEPYHAIVLDVMLPDRDGVELCRNLRRREVKTPILMLTALSETRHKVAGLDAGADDYLAKPFDFEELLARLRALLRRGDASESSLLRYADLELDLVHRRAERSGVKAQLSTKEFALLEYLLRHPERVLHRQTIVEAIWDLGSEPSSNVLEVHISGLRRKIDRGFDCSLIHTVVGVGYRLGAPEEAV